jgi:predicted transcriptional regulator
VEIGLPFNQKRNRIEIIADILNLCRHPQTQTYLRRRTSISYEVLQNCITQLVLNGWINPLKDKHGQVRLEITEKGLNFLDKWMQLQRLMNSKNSDRLVAQPQRLEAVILKSK